MSIDNFIPIVWAVELLENLNDKHVYGSLYNRDYEGDIAKAGDSVKINSIGRISIATYTKDSTALTFEAVDDAQLVLLIDQAKYYAFEIDDVDKRQQIPKLMGDAMREAAWGLSDTMDAFLASALESGVASGNKLSAETSVGTGASDGDAYEILVDLGVKLDEDNTPESGRWVVIPPWYHGMLLKDPRFVSFGTDPNRSTLTNGLVGEAAGFQIHKSNNVPVSGSAYTVIAGHPMAATLAEQINDPEALRPEGSFSDAMKGLHLYGQKITRPDQLASVVATSA